MVFSSLTFLLIFFPLFLALYFGRRKIAWRNGVLLAASLCERAHLHVWDEPMNYIDVLSRMQLEELLLTWRPTLLFVEHDKTFCERVATGTVTL